MSNSDWQRFFGATAATVSNSACTFLSLLIFRKDPSASDFVHLFSSVAMIASVLNSYIFFGGSFGQIKNLRLRGMAAATLGFLLAGTIVVGIFHLPPTPTISCFSLAYLFQVLVAPAYRKAFRKHEFREVYKRIVLFNGINFLAIVFAALSPNPWYLMRASVFVLASYLAIWLADPFFQGEVEAEPLRMRSALNPSVTLLERSVFDQILLLHTGNVIFTWLYYFLSRFISFFGTVFFNFSTERLLSHGYISSRLRWPILWTMCSSVLTIGLSAGWSHDIRIAVLFSQAYAWLLSSWLVALHGSRARTYWSAMAVTLLEIVARWITTMQSNGPSGIAISLMTTTLVASLTQVAISLLSSGLLKAPETMLEIAKCLRPGAILRRNGLGLRSE